MMDSYRRRVALWGFALLLALSVPCAIFMLAFEDRTGNRNDYPSDSDQAAIDFFHAHREDFEKMRSLIESNPFEAVGEEDKYVWPPDAFREAPEAKEEMLQLMRMLRIPWVNGTQFVMGIRLAFWFTGEVGEGASTSKCFHYSSKTQPKNLVQSTEGIIPSALGWSSAFKPIESGWYLRLDSRGAYQN